jgi:hypothetical protein
MTTDLLEYVIHYIQKAHGDRTFVHVTFDGDGALCTVKPWGKDALNYPGKDLVASVQAALVEARQVRHQREVAA